MLLQLGWRNIWRNPRRTAVIMTAIVIGVWSMIFLGALMRGIIDQMVANGIATLTGHLQIHHTGYRSDPVIENSMTDSRAVTETLKRIVPAGAHWASRVRVNAIASNARHSAGITFIGINPGEEMPVSFIGTAVTAGRSLAQSDARGIVIGRALAEKFETKVGRKLLIMSQDTTREVASRSFRIIGIYRAEFESTEKQFAFVTMAAAQDMLKMGDMVSEISVLLPDRAHLERFIAGLKAALPARDYEIHSWQELLPLVRVYLQVYDGFIYMWFLVVFIAMSFGIVNTTLMAVYERIREFGLLKAMGMKPGWIIQGVLVESFFILIIGMAVGNVLSMLSVYALSFTGIDLSALARGSEFAGMSKVIYPVIQGKDVVVANLVVFVLGLAVSAYPAFKAARFTPIEALAHT
jgi:ABC-type lipoprotein release transport system permease subunit